MEITSQCQKCGENISFDAEGLGQNIGCPHCGQETQLVNPVRNAAPLPQHLRPAAAQLAARQRQEIKLEDSLDDIGGAYLGGSIFLAAIVGLVSIIMVITAISEEKNPWPGLVGVLSAIGMVFQGFVAKTLFRATGEAIRLLRRIAANKP